MNFASPLSGILARTVGLALIAALAIAPSSVQASEALLERWYAALFAVDRPAIEALLDERAVIELEDLGVTQTKAEFITALDEWEVIAGDANLAWQLDPEAEASDIQATALVCYRFTDNELMIREIFNFENALIVRSVQTTIGESCDDF
ncbi:nuclear transport factor 2 family protein [uncultured Hoeflea sp.]|uniref:nuclear transport factor 2 family protein n=1 Tax=uncultured Hoeflea sp. TaxID=538666 RepID=UPI0026143E6A|nr:nuclear transport factor 2 family protein [uncultured Hoeflea sp.]